MAFSISDVLKELGVSNDELDYTPQPAENENAETLMEPEKVAEFLDALASPDSLVDELAKLAVLQDWVASNGIDSSELGNYSIGFDDAEKASMLKAASLTVRYMQGRLEELEAREAQRVEAIKIAKKMYSAGHISRDAILDKVSELTAQPADELRTLDKALDLTKTGRAATFGSLSDQSTSSDNPLLDFILS